MNSTNWAKSQKKNKKENSPAPQRGLFSYVATVRTEVPAFPFHTCAKKILGADYALTLVIVGDTRARTLNQQTRQKNYIPNVLSFPLTKDTGEMYINLALAKREAKKIHCSIRDRMAFLFIHGLLHLKGFAHGSRMSEAEHAWCTCFHIIHPDDMLASSHSWHALHTSQSA